MISHHIIHPQILLALAGAGHGAQVLITDGHYAATTNVHPRAPVVHLALRAGAPLVPEVLDAVRRSIPVEGWTAIRPSPDALPCAVQDEVAALLGQAPQHATRAEFYAAARGPDLALCIVTGDTRRFGNVLLTVGVDRDRRA